MATSRIRKITANITDGKHSFSIYTRPDATGKQGVAETVPFDPNQVHVDLRGDMIFKGVADVLSVRLQHLDAPNASDIRATYDTLLTELHAGTWTPGRTFEAAEPDDMAHALAEVTGQPLHVIVQTIQGELDKVALNPDGSTRKDKGGRVVHLYSKAKLYKAFEEEPRVKAALAKIIAERARKMAADAKSAKLSTTGALDLFSQPAAAAN